MNLIKKEGSEKRRQIFADIRYNVKSVLKRFSLKKKINEETNSAISKKSPWKANHND